MGEIRIKYFFSWKNGRAVFELDLDKKTLALKTKPLIGLPPWTNLDYYQCPNCPLHVAQVSHCPAAISLIPIIKNFNEVDSQDIMEVEVIISGRRIIQQASARRSISSIMGLLFAASGCPHTRHLRPMIRFHLPLANENETIMRAISMYLLAQYFKYNNGGEPDLKLAGLKKIYQEMQIVNMTMAERLQSKDGTASSINAMILLDMYAKAIPSAIEGTLEDLRYLFKSYIDLH
ncbi:MAG: hypothetical protein KKB30_04040 [Proteobacteria bacterium]|nr:hypothetical protein [Pseudomonadota bacterium]MBU1714904.1 hypothetical protein [Pseudomonadota bacterium]